MSLSPQVQYLLSLSAIRERSKIVFQAAQTGNLTNFDYHEDRLGAVADCVAHVIKRDFPPEKLKGSPAHGRWVHFDVGNIPRIENTLKRWKSSGVDDLELTRRLIDLFFVSVLVDAGAGEEWRYLDTETGRRCERSEGIAVASLQMFNDLAFTARKSAPVTDGHGLRDLATATLKEGLQWTDSNKIVGLESRVAILRNLGRSLLAHSEIFGDDGRPGHLVDYMIANSPTPDTLDVLLLWDILQKVLIPIWPKDRTVVDGSAIGDAWPLNTLRKNAKSGGDAGEIQPFHKLTQWLTYSLLTPFEQVLKKRWTNVKSLTVLPEYRNGGLLVDLGVLSLKQAALDRGLKASNQSLPRFAASDDVIVEWRALTIALLDVLHPLIVERMETGVDLTMVRVLEAGTWRSGREVAAERRPKTKSSPILIESDGTVF